MFYDITLSQSCCIFNNDGITQSIHYGNWTNLHLKYENKLFVIFIDLIISIWPKSVSWYCCSRFQMPQIFCIQGAVDKSIYFWGKLSFIDEELWKKLKLRYTKFWVCIKKKLHFWWYFNRNLTYLWENLQSPLFIYNQTMDRLWNSFKFFVDAQTAAPSVGFGFWIPT